LNQFLLYLLFSFFITLPLHLFHTTLYFTHKTYSVNSPFVVRKQTHTNAHNHKSTIIALTPMLIFTKPRSSHTSPCSYRQNHPHPYHHYAHNPAPTRTTPIHMLIFIHARSSHPRLCS